MQTMTSRRAHHSSNSSGVSLFSSLPLSVDVHRVAVINFRRLLERLERDVRNAQQGSTEQKEARRSIKEQTLLIKALHSLKAQLESIQPELDKKQTSEYAHRVSHLWSLARVDPVQPPPLPRQYSLQPSQLSTAKQQQQQQQAASPPLPVLSSSSLFPSHSAVNAPASGFRSSSPSSLWSHPIADASLFTFQHSRPQRADVRSLRQQLLLGSSSSSSASSSSASSSSSSELQLSSEQEAGLSALSELAPQLKAQVKAIAAHLKLDEAVVADTSSMLEANVASVRRENVRLKSWARQSCGETCWMTAAIALVLVAFVAMVLLMKLIPAPRS